MGAHPPLHGGQGCRARAFSAPGHARSLPLVRSDPPPRLVTPNPRVTPFPGRIARRGTG